MSDTVIGVSASYDIDENPAEKAAYKYSKDIQNNSSLCTIPLYRGDIHGIDNLKFLYPLNGIPMIAYTLLNAVDQQADCRVIGPGKVGKLAELMNDELGSSITYIKEGPEPALSGSITALLHDAGSRNYFVAGDIPMARDYVTTGYEGDVVYDFNTRNLLVDGIVRNFYNKATTGALTRDFKEPNVYYCSKKGSRMIMEAADFFFSSRKNGGLADAIVEFTKYKYSSDENFRRALRSNWVGFTIQVAKVYLQKAKVPIGPIKLDKMSSIASKLFNSDWRFTFMHNDLFRMLDIDGLNNDWPMYDRAAANLEQAGKLDRRLIRIREAIRSNIGDFPLLQNFEDVVRAYVGQVNEHLEEKVTYPFPDDGSADVITRLLMERYQ